MTGFGANALELSTATAFAVGDDRLRACGRIKPSWWVVKVSLSPPPQIAPTPAQAYGAKRVHGTG